MSDTPLNKMDIDYILDAVDIWEDHEQQLLQTHEYLRSTYTCPERLKEFDAITEAKIRELKSDSKLKRNKAIILKYKLVRMIESIEAQKIIDDLTKGQK